MAEQNAAPAGAQAQRVLTPRTARSLYEKEPCNGKGKSKGPARTHGSPEPESSSSSDGSQELREAAVTLMKMREDNVELGPFARCSLVRMMRAAPAVPVFAPAVVLAPVRAPVSALLVRVAAGPDPDETEDETEESLRGRFAVVPGPRTGGQVAVPRLTTARSAAPRPAAPRRPTRNASAKQGTAEKAAAKSKAKVQRRAVKSPFVTHSHDNPPPRHWQALGMPEEAEEAKRKAVGKSAAGPSGRDSGYASVAGPSRNVSGSSSAGGPSKKACSFSGFAPVAGPSTMATEIVPSESGKRKRSGDGDGKVEKSKKARSERAVKKPKRLED